MRVQEGLCVFGARCLVCQELVSCFLNFFIASCTCVVVSVMLYPCILYVALLMALFVCVLRVCKLFGETIGNLFGCGCYFVV